MGELVPQDLTLIGRGMEIFDVEGKVYDGYYLIGMKIPLSTYHYPENSKSWRFNFFRFHTRRVKGLLGLEFHKSLMIIIWHIWVK